ncbi:MAG: suppressor of fused domain protein [Fusobacterium sp.]|nr:suppressor of fused domain protein [Fusobacterium sp.]
MKKLKFKDEVFKKAIKDLFDLNDDMTLEDLEKIEEIVFYDSDRHEDKETFFVKLDGKIESLEDLKYFPNLKNLSLNFSDPDNPEIFGNLKDVVHLTKLEILNLSGSIIKGNIKLLKELKDLELLTLTGVEIKGNIKDLLEFKKLKKINMCDAKIKGTLKDLVGLDLEKLVLGWTNIKGNLEDLKDFPNLKVLDLNDCEKIKGNLSSLKNLKKLEDISLMSCDISGNLEDLKDLKNLKYIDLACTDTYGNLSHLLKLKNLKEVDLTYSCVDRDVEIVEKLKAKNVEVEIDLEEELEEKLEEDKKIEEKFRYSQKDLDILEKYREKHFGEFENVFHEVVSDALHIDIHVSKPTKERDYYIIMTEGMGAYKMDVPEDLGNKRAELMFYLPSDWNLDFSDEDENNYWPFRWLKILARMPLEEKTWFGNFHSIGNGSGNNYEEMGFASKDKFVALLLMPFINMQTREIEEKIVELENGEKLNILQVAPLYNEELRYKIKKGAYYLLKEVLFKFEDKDFFVLDVNRENIFENDKMEEADFERYKDSRIELENPEQIIKFEDKGFEEAVRKLYKLEGEIRHKDIGYRESLNLVEYLRNGCVDIEKIEMETKIHSFKDLKWFVNLLELGLNHGDPGYPNIFGDLKDVLCLKRLVILNLSGSIVQGNISDLKKLKNLKEIILTGQGIKGKLSDLKDFKDLRIMYICDTRVKGDLKDIQHFDKLEDLILSYSHFTGDIKDLENLKNLKNLKEIDIADCPIKGNLKSLSNLENLRTLSIYENKNISGNIKSLSSLVNLESLDLSCSNIKGDIKSLKPCIKLREIDITDTEIKGDIEFLLDFKCLHDLSIADSEVSYSAKALDEFYKETKVDIVEMAREDEFEEDEEEDSIYDLTMLHRKSMKGLEYFGIFGLEDYDGEGIVHYGFVGDRGTEERIKWSVEIGKEIITQKLREGFTEFDEEMEELKIMLTDFPRVNPYSLAMNIDEVLGETGLGYIIDDDVTEDLLVITSRVVDIEIAQEVLVKEFFEYGISFDKNISTIFN